jgi:hypothetical protein
VPFSAGVRFGPDEIVAAIGAAGMDTSELTLNFALSTSNLKLVPVRGYDKRCSVENVKFVGIAA